MHFDCLIMRLRVTSIFGGNMAQVPSKRCFDWLSYKKDVSQVFVVDQASQRKVIVSERKRSEAKHSFL